ncbi:MAG: FadR family transcriptional regulator [Clostridia bacterium]|nr:FadR family transcriptional regulator [Clostridia bacterium]NCC44013.1 FadR family transcriptional regulator [Clostridia bacterium]
MAETQKAYFQVIDYIKQLAKEQKIVFGGKIPSERELMETLELSRNSVREALRSLENMGIIESRHGKGNFLVNHMGRSLSSVFSMMIFMKQSDYRDLNTLRRAMETQAYLLAVERMDEEKKKKIAAIIKTMKNGSHKEQIQADHDFHRAIIEYSGNQMLALMMDALSEVCEDEITLILENATTEYVDIWLEVHGKMYECLVDEKPEEGIEAVMKHYEWIDNELKKMENGF